VIWARYLPATRNCIPPILHILPKLRILPKHYTIAWRSIPRNHINSELNLSERRLLQGKTNNTDPDNNIQSTEAQVRLALEHMGGQRLSLGSGSNGNLGRGGASPASSRHRYVRDGEVPVVHAALGRAGARPDAAVQQDKALIETMRHDLDRERSAHEAAERVLHETRAALVNLQTRLAHVEMDLQAAKEAAQQSAQEAAEQQLIAQAATAQVATVQAAGIQAANTQAVTAGDAADETSRPIRRRARKLKAATQREPQPVKWWIKAGA
jgi:hypothetical protein